MAKPLSDLRYRVRSKRRADWGRGKTVSFSLPDIESRSRIAKSLSDAGSRAELGPGQNCQLLAAALHEQLHLLASGTRRLGRDACTPSLIFWETSRGPRSSTPNKFRICLAKPSECQILTLWIGRMEDVG